MNALQLDDLYRGRSVPAWLRSFEDEPVEALHDLLVGGAWLGHLNPADPQSVLLDWMEGLGESLVENVDAALASWLKRFWGTHVLPRSAESAELSAEAWRRAFDLISSEPRLEAAPAALRRYLPEDRAFLSSLREGRLRDPEGRAWLALARHQDDRDLIALWWWLVDLPPDIPWYHGRYGLHGLRGLSKDGGFSIEVAEGLARLGRALERRVEDGWLLKPTAQNEFLRVARTTMWAYNFYDRWLKFWRQTLPRDGQSDGIADSWVRKLFPDKLKQAHSNQWKVKRHHVKRDPGWPGRSQDLARALRHPDTTILAEARQLLRDEQDYAEATGDSYYVVRTACNFAMSVQGHDPGLALEWARLARRFDPTNAYAWTTETSSLLKLGELDDARRRAFEAVRLFPYNDVAHNALAEVLRIQGRLDDAEDVYRESVRRFPQTPVARTGLGEVLRDKGRLDDAEDVYRETVERFPDDPVARTGLGEVLRAQGRLDDAEDVYREAVRRFPENPVARTGLGGVLYLRKRLPEAEAMYQAVLRHAPGDVHAKAGLRKVRWTRQGKLAQKAELAEDPVGKPSLPSRDAPSSQLGDIEIVLQDAFLLRHWARDLTPPKRRERARRLLERLAEASATYPMAASELGLLGVALEEIDETLDLLRRAAERFPGSARVRYALACVERAVSIRDADGSEERLRSWKKLGRLDERLRPLQLLGEARVFLVGGDRDEKVRDRFGELGWWIERTLDNVDKAELEGWREKREKIAFNAAWARDLRHHLFAGRSVKRAEDIEDLDAVCANLVEHEKDLAYQEETYLTQVTVA